MEPFELVQPTRLEDALELLARPDTAALAGGTDLLDRMKDHLDTPRVLVSLRRLGLGETSFDPARGLRVGALTSLAALAVHPVVRARYPALAASAAHAATPNLRAQGTLGGSLAQRPRCWYFRSEAFFCRRHGGNTCFAHDGENQLHAIFDNGVCGVIHPSTLATPLLAYDAAVVIASARGRRSLPLGAFFVAPGEDVTRENVLLPGELLAEVTIPPPAAGTRSAYLKQGQRESTDWPLADVAVALVLEGGLVTSARVALGAAAPTPMRASAAEVALVGNPPDEPHARAAADAALRLANPMSKNRYKVEVFRAVIARAIVAAGASREERP
jgi:xanthine dehydrogenase YagS FAD-binding subunit